ncbi:Type A flavoprotein FprA [uncultured archaeon]|nr:Type A flavoprotein FprA [uncultured archaeon]
MSLIRVIKPGIQWLGAIDWDRKLFDALIPLLNGTIYNSYLIKGSEKTALVDAVDTSMLDVLLGNLKALDIGKIDYIISQHAEQDHSGSIKKLAELYPDAKIVASGKCKELLVAFSLVSEDRVMDVKDGQKLSLATRHWSSSKLLEFTGRTPCLPT